MKVTISRIFALILQLCTLFFLFSKCSPEMRIGALGGFFFPCEGEQEDFPIQLADAPSFEHSIHEASANRTSQEHRPQQPNETQGSSVTMSGPCGGKLDSCSVKQY